MKPLVSSLAPIPKIGGDKASAETKTRVREKKEKRRFAREERKEKKGNKLRREEKRQGELIE